MIVHICDKCEVEHRDGEPECWLCGGPTRDVGPGKDQTAERLWEISAVRSDAAQRGSEVA